MLALDPPFQPLTPVPGVRLFTGDARAVLPQLEPASFDSLIVSAQQWQKIPYLPAGHPAAALELGLEADPNEFLDAQFEVFAAAFRLMKPGSALVIDMGDTSNNESALRRKMGDRAKAVAITNRRKIWNRFREKELLTVSDWLTLELKDIGWLHRRNIIWVRTKGGRLDDGYGRRDVDAPHVTHQTIGYFVKPVWSGSRETANYYNDVYGGTVWLADPESDPVHPCPMPKAIADKAIRMTVPISQTAEQPVSRILCPYSGSGTVALVAAHYGLEATGIDLYEGFTERACARLVQAQTKPIVLPSFSRDLSGTCPKPAALPQLKHRHEPTGWIEPAKDKLCYRYKEGSKKPCLTLQSRSEEALVRSLLQHRIYRAQVVTWLKSYRGDRLRTVARLGKVLPTPYLELLRQAEAEDRQIEETLAPPV